MTRAGGVVVTLAYHSGEDRRIKHGDARARPSAAVASPSAASDEGRPEPPWEALTRKVVTLDVREIARNPACAERTAPRLPEEPCMSRRHRRARPSWLAPDSGMPRPDVWLCRRVISSDAAGRGVADARAWPSSASSSIRIARRSCRRSARLEYMRAALERRTTRAELSPVAARAGAGAGRRSAGGDGARPSISRTDASPGETTVPSRCWRWQRGYRVRSCRRPRHAIARELTIRSSTRSGAG